METIGRRGTTFVVPYVIKNFELSNIDELCLVMAQGRNIIVKKKLEDVSIESDTINVSLSQEETLRFNAKMFIKNQIKFKIGNEVFATKETYSRIDDILCEEVI